MKITKLNISKRTKIKCFTLFSYNLLLYLNDFDVNWCFWEESLHTSISYKSKYSNEWKPC